MPSSVRGRLISGSWTVARAAWTASSAGEPVSVSDIVASVSFGGEPGPRDGRDLRIGASRHRTGGGGARPGRRVVQPLYGGVDAVPPRAGVICRPPGPAEAPQPPRPRADRTVDR